VADEFRFREQVESAFLQATSPAKAPVFDIPQSTAIMAALVVKGTALDSFPSSNASVLSNPLPAVSSVSPESASDSTSIAGLKARLAALQVRTFFCLMLYNSYLISNNRLLASPHPPNQLLHFRIPPRLRRRLKLLYRPRPMKVIRSKGTQMIA
jgi:hypothetical protein